jgi:hypothetical protein
VPIADRRASAVPWAHVHVLDSHGRDVYGSQSSLGLLNLSASRRSVSKLQAPGSQTLHLHALPRCLALPTSPPDLARVRIEQVCYLHAPRSASAVSAWAATRGTQPLLVPILSLQAGLYERGTKRV